MAVPLGVSLFESLSGRVNAGSAARFDRLLAVVGVIALGLLLRACVGVHPHSGERTPPMYGDYEAQRHWMEITTHLAPSEWYVSGPHNDLLYWGLDYPPLTAYHSWLCGVMVGALEPEAVALGPVSRGYSSPTSRAILRTTVLVSDGLVFLSAATAFAFLASGGLSWPERALLLLLILVQPSFILIDHGHFQYNCVALGAVLWMIVAVRGGRDCLAAALFVAALSFKHMTLYYALPVFCLLLGRALSAPQPLRSLTAVALTTLATFAVLWAPFLVSPPHSLSAVLTRLFPWGRGLYEDKVANLWCSLSPLVKIKEWDGLLLRKLTTGTTLLASLPSCVWLLTKPSVPSLLLSLFNVSLSFFLFSFQVHEKSILMPLLPMVLLLPRLPKVASLFTIASFFSMFPLLEREKLAIAYGALTVIYLLILYGLVRKNDVEWWELVCLSGMVVLHIGNRVVTPPSHLPDLFPLLFSVYSAGIFGCCLLATNWVQYCDWRATR